MSLLDHVTTARRRLALWLHPTTERERQRRRRDVERELRRLDDAEVYRRGDPYIPHRLRREWRQFKQRMMGDDDL